jgi:hypothetical protein
MDVTIPNRSSLDVVPQRARQCYGGCRLAADNHARPEAHTDRAEKKNSSVTHPHPGVFGVDSIHR